MARLKALVGLTLLIGLLFAAPARTDEAGIPHGLLIDLSNILNGSSRGPEGMLPEGELSALIVSIQGDGDELFRLRTRQSDLAAGPGPLLARIPWTNHLRRADAIDVVLIGEARPVTAPIPDNALFGNASRGRIELQVTLNGQTRQFSPDRVIADNQSHRYLIGRALKDWGTDWAQLKDAREVTLADTKWYRAQVFKGSVAPLREVIRGRFLPGARPDDRQQASRALAAAIAWFRENIRADGTFPYGYWPSSGRFRKDNNAIRQWLATLALADITKRMPGDRSVESLLGSNIAGNKALFVRNWNGRTVVMHDGKIKLGAMGIAALAMLRGRPQEERKTIDALRDTIESMRNPDGSFTTFLLPADRDDNQNFYPGEALLFLSEYHRHHPDPARLDRILRSLDHYWRWHMINGNRNPAFVPWHLMAHVALGSKLIGKARVERVFRMADWLATLQQVEAAPAADMAGRFYAPGKDYGPPHTSSTSIYAEGICHAARLARAAGDRGRAQHYDKVAALSLGNLAMLQYGPRLQTPFVSRENFGKLAGALPNNSYDNRIRVDNIAHFGSFLACRLSD